MMRPLRCRLLILVTFAGLALWPVQAQTLQVDEIKANYIEGFMDFVRWNGEINQREAVIGVIGSRELVNHLERIAQDKRRGRALRVVRLRPGDSFDQLDIVVVGAGLRHFWPTIFEKAKAAQTLLIGEEEGFVRSGGCIEFVVRKNRLRFIVDAENAQALGIKLSSKLVELSAD